MTAETGRSAKQGRDVRVPHGESLGTGQSDRGIRVDQGSNDPTIDAMRAYIANDDLSHPASSMRVTAALNAVDEVVDAGILDGGTVPTARSSRSERLTVELYRGIATGEIGEQLPPDQEITDQTGFSRSTIREGVAGLKGRGIVETVHGVGTFVTRRENIPDAAGRDSVLEATDTEELASAQDIVAEQPVNVYREFEPTDPIVGQLRDFITHDDGSDPQKSMAATMALNALRNAEQVIFGASDGVAVEIPENQGRPSLSEKVATDVYTAIADGEITDRIPGEVDLSQMLGVSRATVRQGMIILSTGGIVDVRHGTGAVVTNRDTIRGAQETQ